MSRRLYFVQPLTHEVLEVQNFKLANGDKYTPTGLSPFRRREPISGTHASGGRVGGATAQKAEQPGEAPPPRRRRPHPLDYESDEEPMHVDNPQLNRILRNVHKAHETELASLRRQIPAPPPTEQQELTEIRQAKEHSDKELAAAQAQLHTARQRLIKHDETAEAIAAHEREIARRAVHLATEEKAMKEEQRRLQAQIAEYKEYPNMRDTIHRLEDAAKQYQQDIKLAAAERRRLEQELTKTLPRLSELEIELQKQELLRQEHLRAQEHKHNEERRQWDQVMHEREQAAQRAGMLAEAENGAQELQAALEQQRVTLAHEHELLLREREDAAHQAGVFAEAERGAQELTQALEQQRQNIVREQDLIQQALTEELVQLRATTSILPVNNNERLKAEVELQKKTTEFERAVRQQKEAIARATQRVERQRLLTVQAQRQHLRAEQRLARALAAKPPSTAARPTAEIGLQTDRGTDVGQQTEEPEPVELVHPISQTPPARPALTVSSPAVTEYIPPRPPLTVSTPVVAAYTPPPPVLAVGGHHQENILGIESERVQALEALFQSYQALQGAGSARAVAAARDAIDTAHDALLRMGTRVMDEDEELDKESTAPLLAQQKNKLLRGARYVITQLNDAEQDPTEEAKADMGKLLKRHVPLGELTQPERQLANRALGDIAAGRFSRAVSRMARLKEEVKRSTRDYAIRGALPELTLVPETLEPPIASSLTLSPGATVSIPETIVPETQPGETVLRTGPSISETPPRAVTRRFDALGLVPKMPHKTIVHKPRKRILTPQEQIALRRIELHPAPAPTEAEREFLRKTRRRIPLQPAPAVTTQERHFRTVATTPPRERSRSPPPRAHTPEPTAPPKRRIALQPAPVTATDKATAQPINVSGGTANINIGAAPQRPEKEIHPPEAAFKTKRETYGAATGQELKQAERIQQNPRALAPPDLAKWKANARKSMDFMLRYIPRRDRAEYIAQEPHLREYLKDFATREEKMAVGEVEEPEKIAFVQPDYQQNSQSGELEMAEPDEEEAASEAEEDDEEEL